MAVSAFNNDYVARLEWDRDELLNALSSLAHEAVDIDDQEVMTEVYSVLERVREPLPEKRKSW